LGVFSSGAKPMPKSCMDGTTLLQQHFVLL